MFLILGSFVLFSALLAIAPGPDNTFVLVQSMRYGAKNGLAIVLGLVLGCAVHTSYVVFGVAALLEQSALFGWVLKLFGTFYMLYLAYGLLKDKEGGEAIEAEGAAGSTGHMIRTGFLMNVLNPKVAIFFLSFFPGFLFSEHLSTSWQFAILGLVFMLVTFTVFGGIALGGSRLSQWMQIERRAATFRYVQIGVFLLVIVFLWLE